jgi:hypothetical protein
MRDATDVLGGRRPTRQFPGPQPAKVVRVAGDQLFVELNGLRGAEFQARWSRPTSTVEPPAGTACLVMFADAGVADAWVVAFDRWPA